MGFFNAMQSINKINGLLKDLENQVAITADQLQSGASVTTLNNSLEVHKRIHQTLIDTFCQSSGARVSMFTFLGQKIRMHGILSLSKKMAMDLYAEIKQRS